MAKMTLKEKYRLLRNAGYSSKDATLYRNRSDAKVKDLVNKKAIPKKKVADSEKERWKANYRRLRDMGLSVKDASRLRTGHQATVDEILRTGRIPKKGDKKKPVRESKTGGYKLVLLWSDKTDFADDRFIQDTKAEMRKTPLPQLIREIQGWSQGDFGEIGRARIEVTKDLSELWEFTREDWIIAYEGEAQNYKHLLVGVAAVLLGLYQAIEKNMFMHDLAQTIFELNPDMAKRFYNDFLRQ